MTKVAFALNHMVAPARDLAAFFALARTLGLGAVEIRNDLPGRAIANGTPAAEVRALAERAGVSILSINALYPFDVWSEDRARQARALVEYAAACGAKGIVMVPLNDPGDRRSAADRRSDLRRALAGLKPMLEAAGVVGLVEPLGFAECALRLKRDAVEAIDAVGGAGAFKLVHDTFHHHVAGETELFPELTGLVHISGVVDPAVPREAMRDPHRVLVDGRDRVDNVGQVRALVAGDYRGPLSFEPFAAEVHAMPRIEDALRASMAVVSGALAGPAA